MNFPPGIANHHLVHLQIAKKQEAHHPHFHEDDMLPSCISMKIRRPNFSGTNSLKKFSYFWLSATATATATVAPTMGLLPMPKKPIISTENPPCGGFSVGA